MVQRVINITIGLSLLFLAGCVIVSLTTLDFGAINTNETFTLTIQGSVEGFRIVQKECLMRKVGHMAARHWPTIPMVTQVETEMDFPDPSLVPVIHVWSVQEEQYPEERHQKNSSGRLAA